MSDGDTPSPEERFDGMSAVFSEIVIRAEELSRTRCPYRDRHDLCTALFQCSHQAPTADADPGDLSCRHDGSSEYRSAWMSSPRLLKPTQKKKGRTRRDAKARRPPNREDR